MVSGECRVRPRVHSGVLAGRLPVRGLGALGCSARVLLGTAGGAGLLAAAALVGLDLGLLTDRGQDHDHVAAVLTGVGLDGAQLGHLLGQALQEPDPELGPGLLAAAEADDALDLVPALEESLDVAALGGVVVLIDLGAELDLLELGVCLVASRVARLHGRLVLELAVVHELAHRWAGVGCHLDQVEVGLLSQTQGVLHADNADLLAAGADETHFGNADPFVDTGLADVGSSL